MSKPEVVAGGNAILGESPLWSPAEAALYWVDINNPTIHRLDPASGARERWHIETEIGSIGLAGPRRMVAGLRTGAHYVDLETGKIEPICDPEGEGRFNRNRMNDGKIDRAGRFWVGTMNDPGHQPLGTLYCIDKDGGAAPVLGGIRVPNALCWSPDSRVMYFTDSYSHQIWAFDFDLETGAMENKRVFAAIAEDAGVPDGATVDADGFVWCAHMFGSRVSRYAPDGSLDRDDRAAGAAGHLMRLRRGGSGDALHHHRLAPHGPGGACRTAARRRAVRRRPRRARPAGAGLRRLTRRRG